MGGPGKYRFDSEPPRLIGTEHWEWQAPSTCSSAGPANRRNPAVSCDCIHRTEQPTWAGAQSKTVCSSGPSGIRDRSLARGRMAPREGLTRPAREHTSVLLSLRNHRTSGGDQIDRIKMVDSNARDAADLASCNRRNSRRSFTSHSCFPTLTPCDIGRDKAQHIG
jgi:hypothetical protein